ncbi:aquaporin AQPAn.G-like [Cydia pomonella]|uniref:aquaporin AQPAn.G-like n=1 Tax=Cydia pomonella TaxID=82600 RepID=UPI002ADDECF2|nr:aquaporin AQPAn.G-like [Cydia pomonella]
MDYVKCGVIQSLCAELIGTLIICGILLSGSTLISSKSYRNETHNLQNDHELNKLSEKSADPSDKALAYGLTVTSVVTYTVHISGGHFNPAITLGAIICRDISIILGTCYVLAQIIGALIGEVLAKLIVEKKQPDQESSEFAIGVLASFMLVSVYLSVTDTRKFGKDVGSAPLAVGLTITALALSEDRISMNPAISLATSMHYEDFIYTWVDWIAPLLGGLMAGIVYRTLTKYYDLLSVRVNYSNSFVTVTASKDN